MRYIATFVKFSGAELCFDDSVNFLLHLMPFIVYTFYFADGYHTLRGFASDDANECKIVA